MNLIKKCLPEANQVLLLITILTIGFSHLSEANLRERLLFRRQSSETSSNVEGNTQESTTAASSTASAPNEPSAQIPPRLYPDLPRFNPNNPPTLGGFRHHPQQANFRPFGQQTPFVPFGWQNHQNMPNNNGGHPMNNMQPTNPMMMMRPATAGNTNINQAMAFPSPFERLQSQSFTSGLGRRLLSMIGISGSDDSTGSSANNTTNSNGNSMMIGGRQMAPGARNQWMMPSEETMRALQNSTVLQQLNQGVQSLYGSLSKMYNMTVQQQLDLLQNRYKRESENSTQVWQQRLAQQVPQFFKSVAMKVNEAQENLNRIMSQMSQQVRNSSLATAMASRVNNNNQSSASDNQSMAPRVGSSFFDQFGGDGSFGNGMMDYDLADNSILQSGGGGGGFINQLSRSLGFGGGSNDPRDMMNNNNNNNNNNRATPGQMNWEGQLMGFWHNQVQPQINMMRDQLGRLWRDLSRTGMLQYDSMMGSRDQAMMGVMKNDSSNEDLVDNILKGVDMNVGSDFALVEPKSDSSAPEGNKNNNGQEQQPAMVNNMVNGMSTRMQNNLMNMQREMNRLWNGLSNSLQNALKNVKNQMNPSGRLMVQDSLMNNNNNKQSEMSNSDSSSEQEIEMKLRQLTRLQREADTVGVVVQQQQQAQQQQAPNQPTMGGRFKNFFNNMDFRTIQELPHRVGDHVSKFGATIGNFWQQIPERWDNFISMRQPELMRQANTNTNNANTNMNTQQNGRLTGALSNQRSQDQVVPSSTALP